MTLQHIPTPTSVTLNLFQGPFFTTRSSSRNGAERADGEAARNGRELSIAARWILKQVQEDEKGKGEKAV